MFRILFVCMGNICRSPTAEGVFRARLAGHRLADAFIIDSAGIEHYHTGDAPDLRAQAAAERRGYDLSRLRARQVEAADFALFDLILAMDARILGALERRCPPAHRHKLKSYMDYALRYDEAEVADPYYGDRDDFEHVLDLVEDVSEGLMKACLTRQKR